MMKKSIFALLVVTSAAWAHATPAEVATEVVTKKPAVVSAIAPLAPPAPAAAASSSVTIKGANATVGLEPKLAIKGGQSVEAKFDAVSAAVKSNPTWSIFKIEKRTETIARLYLVSGDKSTKFELDIANDSWTMLKLKKGDSVLAKVSEEKLIVFAKDNIPLGFMVKEGVKVNALVK